MSKDQAIAQQSDEPSQYGSLASQALILAKLQQPKGKQSVDLKEQARKGCGDCCYQSCDYPNCVTEKKL